MAPRSNPRRSAKSASQARKEPVHTTRTTRSSTKLKEASNAVHVAESLTTPQKPTHNTRVTRSSVKFAKPAEITLGTGTSTSPLTADPSAVSSQPDGLPLRSKPCFFELPPEIRVEIYTIIAQTTPARVLTEGKRTRLARPMLTLTNRQFYKEFMTEFWTSAETFIIEVKDFDFRHVPVFAAELLEHNLKRLPYARKDSHPDPRILVISLNLTQTEGPEGMEFNDYRILTNFVSAKGWIKYMSKHRLGQGLRARDISTTYEFSPKVTWHPDGIGLMDELHGDLEADFTRSRFFTEDVIKKKEAGKILRAMGQWMEDCAMVLASDSDSHFCICGECYPESDFSE